MTFKISNWTFILWVSCIASLGAWQTYGLAIGATIFYACVGGLLNIFTQSRGIVADILFATLWPIYFYSDWKAGRL